MKRPLSDNLKAMALVLTVATPMSYVVQISMGIYLSGWYLLLIAAASILILEIIGYNRITAITIPSIIVLAAAFVWWILDKEQRQFFIDYYWWAVGFIYQWSQYPLGSAMVLTAITTFLTTLIVWLFGRKFFFFPAVFVFVTAIVLLKWLSGLDNVLVPGMMAVGGLILLWAKSFQKKTEKKTGKTLPENGIALFLLPVSALIVLLSLVSIPVETARDWQNRQVHDMFERFNNFLSDYTNFNRPRNSFSIASYGFMPMGSRLGGPTELSDTDVLYVAAPRRLLLRGTVYNNYTGNSWADTTNSQRMRFSGTNKAQLDDAFDLMRPGLSGTAAAQFKQFVEPITLYIRPLVYSPSTLFAPFRGVTGVYSDKFLAVLPYFNPKGEVFSSSDVHADYSYRVAADYLRYDAAGFNEMMDGLMGMGLKDSADREAYIREYYTTLPDNIEKQVYDLTEAITSGTVISSAAASGGASSSQDTTAKAPPEIKNAYDKALAIKDYLKKNFKYTLSPSVPPENRDFVSYFINDDRNGYCTYFASAMAVMARIAGIPSRYVEGYLMPSKPQDSPVYDIKGINAHAWAELYFDGIGWIPFDATPSGEDASSDPGGNYGNIEPMPTPTHPDSGSSDNTNINNINKKALTWDDIAGYLWILPVALAALALLWMLAMMIWARTKASPRYIGRKYTEMSRRCAWYYYESLKLLDYYNYAVKKGETPYAYAVRIDRWLRLEAGTFARMAQLISLISYSDYAPTEKDVDFMALFRRQLAKYTYQTVGPSYYLWHQVLGFKPRATRLQDR